MDINKQYHCFSLKLCGWLCSDGFVLFEVQDDVNSRRKIYMFKDSVALRASVNEYMNQKK